MDLLIFYKVLCVILAYLFGSFPTGFVLYKIRTGKDIRDVGSGNVGGTNVTRVIGRALGVLTIFVDIIKGFLPVLAIYFIFPEDLVLLSIVAVIVVVGHIFPVYLKFKGGKGISTSYGAILGLCLMPFIDSAPWLRVIPVVAILIAWLTTFAISRIVSLASLVAAIVTPLSFYFSKYPLPIVIAAICFFILTFVAHRDNIKRLIKGEEKKLKGKGA